MRLLKILLDFGRRFGAKIEEKSDLELQGLEKRKTLQNAGRGSKNQGLAYPKIMKNHKKSEMCSSKQRRIKRR